MGGVFGKRKCGERSGSAPARLEGLSSGPASAPARQEGVPSLPPWASSSEPVSTIDAPSADALKTPPRARDGGLQDGLPRKLSYDDTLDLGAAVDQTNSDKSPLHTSSSTQAGQSGQPPRVIQQVSFKNCSADDVQLASKLFGASTLEALHSKAWADRERALKQLRAALEAAVRADWECPNPAAPNYQELWQATINILQTTVRDKVAPVYFTSLEVLRVAVSTCAAHLAPSCTQNGLDLIVPALLHRSCNLNPRISQGSVATICFLAGEPSVGSEYMVPYVLEPVRSSAKNKNSSITGRLELLMQLMHAVGLADASPLSTSRVLAFVLPALETPDDKVRHAAVSVVLEVYLRNGNTIHEKHLVALKPALRKMLQRKMAEAEIETAGSTGTGSVGVSALPALEGAPSKLEGLEHQVMMYNDRTLVSNKLIQRQVGSDHKIAGSARKRKNAGPGTVGAGMLRSQDCNVDTSCQEAGPTGPAPTRLKTPANHIGPAKYEYSGRVKTPLVRSGDQISNPHHAPRKGKPPRHAAQGVAKENKPIISRTEEDLMESILCAADDINI